MVKKVRYRFTVDGRGKISSGEKKNNLPHALDYFDISDFPELVKMYGEKPTQLIIKFPSDEILDFFDTSFNSWGTGAKGPVKKRACDGETCIHRISEKINGIDYAAGEETGCICESLPEDSKDRCRFDAWMKAFVCDKTGLIENTSCYMFTTHSQNSADAIYSELMKIKELNQGILRYVPFLLSVKMCSGKLEAIKKFPIWSLQVIGLLSEIRANSGKMIGGGSVPLLMEGQIEQKPNIPETPESSDPKKMAADLREYILAINNQDKTKSQAWLKAEQLRLHLGIIPFISNMLEMDIKTMYDANRSGINKFFERSTFLDGKE